MVLVRTALLVVMLSAGMPVQSATLIELARTDDAAAVRTLTGKRKEAVNTATPDGTTALHWAVHNDNEALVKKLLAAGADPNKANRYGATPLSEAAVTGNLAIIRALLKAGADVNAANSQGQTALMVVARSANVEAARELIKHGADVNAVEQWRGQTALIWAAAQSQPEMVELLLAHGADPDARSWVNRWERQITAEPRYSFRPTGGLSALIYAAREGCIRCVAALLAAGADIDQTDGEGSTALLVALLNLHFDLARLLIEAGANVNKWDLRGYQPLYIAVDLHTLPTGGRPDRPSTDETTALDIIDLLIARGANVNAQLKAAQTFRSISDDRGADVIISIGATPLLRAAKAFDLVVVERLLQHGALPNLPNYLGITPVMAAAGLGVSPVDTRGNYSLADVQGKAVATLELLLAYGGDLNLRDAEGRTAAHGAAFWGWSDVVGWLARQGADLRVASNDGTTPHDVALGKMRMSRGRAGSGDPHPETAELIARLAPAS